MMAVACDFAFSRKHVKMPSAPRWFAAMTMWRSPYLVPESLFTESRSIQWRTAKGDGTFRDHVTPLHDIVVVIRIQ